MVNSGPGTQVLNPRETGINRVIPDGIMSRFSELIASRIGLNFPRERWDELEKKIISASGDFNFSDAESCIKWFLSTGLTKKHLEALAGHLTIGETYFFREIKSFEILEKHILPEIIHSRKEKFLRIWVAGCSTGEEPYSISILLKRIIPDLKDWNITILATDINTNAIRKASEGVYRKWSFRETPLWVRERYFTKTKEGSFETYPEIKKMVTFAYHNLAEDPYPSLLNNTYAMDIIFCRNVLMYFVPEVAKKVIQNFYCSLSDKGWLIVSPGEVSSVLYPQFVTINFEDTIIYKKDIRKYKEVEPETEPVIPPVREYREPLPAIPVKDPWEEAPLKPEVNPYDEALALYKEGLYGVVVEKLSGVLLRDRGDPKGLTLLARAYANQGKIEEALKCSERAIDADKLDPSLHYLRATILQELGKIEEAILSLKKTLYLNPDSVLAHFSLGNLALRQGKFKEQERHFMNALSLLSKYKQEDILEESEGITAGRLTEIIKTYIQPLPRGEGILDPIHHNPG